MTNTQKEMLIKKAYEKETERLEKSITNRALLTMVSVIAVLLAEVNYSYDILPVGFFVTVIVVEGIGFVFSLIGPIFKFLRDTYKVYVEKENLK